MGAPQAVFVTLAECCFAKFFLIVLVMTVVMVLWWSNERSRAAIFACDRGDFFSSLLLMKFFLAFFLDCLWRAIWLYFEFVVKYFSGSLFMAKGGFIVFFSACFYHFMQISID